MNLWKPPMPLTRPLLPLLLALLAGCASPPSRFYTLSAGSPAGAATMAPTSIAIDRVSIPAAVDRPEIVVTSGPNQVALQEFERWAAPLEDEIARVVAGNLGRLLGAAQVTWADAAAAREAAWRVGIEVQQFDSTPGVAADLTAVWSLRRRADGHTLGGRTSARVPVAGAGYDALAAAHSEALARLSQDLADGLLALERTGPQPR